MPVQFGEQVAETVTGDIEHDVSPEATTYQMLTKRSIRDAFPDVEVLFRIYLNE